MIYLIAIAWLSGIVAVCLLVYGASERRYWTQDDEELDQQEQAEWLETRR